MKRVEREQMFEIVGLPQAGRIVRRARAYCGCGARGEVPINNSLPPETIVKKFAERGWVRTGHARLCCPRCAGRERPRPTRDLEAERRARLERRKARLLEELAALERQTAGA